MSTIISPQGLWAGPWSAKVLLLVVALLALLALGITGSFYNAGVAMVEGGHRGPVSWEAIHTAFHDDILGKRSILVSGMKTLFAVGIAFVVARKLAIRKGDVKFSVLGMELSGAQSKAMVWCIVFVLVKWL